MKPSTDEGTILDSEFHVEESDGIVSLVLESRFGNTRNRDYHPALELLLSRLRQMDALVVDAVVDSTVSRTLPFEERRLRIRNRSYPIRLATEDIRDLRIAIGAAQESVAQRPGAKGGNRHKRIRLYLEGIGPAGLTDRLATGLTSDQELTEAKEQIQQLANPRRSRRGQGRESDPLQRAAVELRAMEVTSEWLEEEGWDVFDVSMERLGYDLRAVGDKGEVHVEVKGTRESGTSVLLTPNEVDHALSHPGQSVLAVVSNIVLSRADGDWKGMGGDLRVFNRWQPQAGVLKVLSYEWFLPETSEGARPLSPGTEDEHQG